MEEDQMILVQSIEGETGIKYAFLFNQDDAAEIFEKVGENMIETANGYVFFREDGLVEIKQGASRAFLNTDEVLTQINAQLH